eukprot:Nk52_evm25s96 gene=Nk52_evmTU25s96
MSEEGSGREKEKSSKYIPPHLRNRGRGGGGGPSTSTSSLRFNNSSNNDSEYNSRNCDNEGQQWGNNRKTRRRGGQGRGRGGDSRHYEENASLYSRRSDNDSDCGRGGRRWMRRNHDSNRNQRLRKGTGASSAGSTLGDASAQESLMPTVAEISRIKDSRDYFRLVNALDGRYRFVSKTETNTHNILTEESEQKQLCDALKRLLDVAVLLIRPSVLESCLKDNNTKTKEEDNQYSAFEMAFEGNFIDSDPAMSSSSWRVPEPSLQKMFAALSPLFRKLREGVFSSGINGRGSLNVDQGGTLALSPFPLEVYELSGRVSLLCGDFSEFSKSLSTLCHNVYGENSAVKDRTFVDNTSYSSLHKTENQWMMRYCSFFVLYYGCTLRRTDVFELSQFMQKLNGGLRSRCLLIQHGLDLVSSFNECNYVRFFRLLLKANVYQQCLLLPIISEFRSQSIRQMKAAYYQLPIRIVIRTLGFHHNIEDFATTNASTQNEEANTGWYPQTDEDKAYFRCVQFLSGEAIEVDEGAQSSDSNGLVVFKRRCK